MNILHLLISGGLGGIETLCKNIVLTGKEKHYLCFLWEGGPVAEQLARQGKTVFLLGEKKRALWRTQRKLRRICREKEIQVVNLQHGGPFVDLQLLWLKKAFPRICFVSTEHCFADYYKTQLRGGWKKWLWQASYKCKFRAVDLVLAVSQGVRKSYVECFGLPPQKVRVVYNGVGRDLLDQGKRFLEERAKEPERSDGPLRLLFVGRMDGLKGCEYLLRALRQPEESVVLTFVGDGSQRPLLERMAEKIIREFESNSSINQTIDVIFKGNQTNIGEYLKAADLFVYPPVFPEAFGLAPAEAMAFGVPCIVTDMGGLRELVRDGENGYLCKAADPDSLRCAIGKMMVQYREGKGEAFRRAARETAEYFSIDRTVACLEACYRELLEGKEKCAF